MDEKNLDRENQYEHNDETEVVPEEEMEDPRTALRRLREKLKKCSEERQEYLSGWQRARADFANAKRDEETRRASMVAAAKFDFLSELIVIVDSFDMALDNGSEGSWKAGVENIRSQCLALLRRHGITPYEPLGEHFNPREHESVSTGSVESPEKNNRIIAVLQRGYRTEDKVLRPAKVKVGIYESN